MSSSSTKNILQNTQEEKSNIEAVFTLAIDFKYQNGEEKILELGDGFPSNYSGFYMIEGKDLKRLLVEDLAKEFKYIFLIQGNDRISGSNCHSVREHYETKINPSIVVCKSMEDFALLY